jgi:hypothetical protein
MMSWRLVTRERYDRGHSGLIQLSKRVSRGTLLRWLLAVHIAKHADPSSRDAIGTPVLIPIFFFPEGSGSKRNARKGAFAEASAPEGKKAPEAALFYDATSKYFFGNRVTWRRTTHWLLVQSSTNDGDKRILTKDDFLRYPLPRVIQKKYTDRLKDRGLLPCMGKMLQCKESIESNRE